MPALSFKSRFVPLVESGAKRHTIRALRSRPFRSGDALSLFYGMRTKQCRRLFNAPCLKVEEIGIWVYPTYLVINIDGNKLTSDEKRAFAIRDGFDSEPDMAAFWAAEHGLGHFSGQVIHWDFDRREVI